jgi:hypothetical protein
MEPTPRCNSIKIEVKRQLTGPQTYAYIYELHVNKS